MRIAKTIGHFLNAKLSFFRANSPFFLHFQKKVQNKMACILQYTDAKPSPRAATIPDHLMLKSSFFNGRIFIFE